MKGTGTLEINGVDVGKEYGVILGDGSLNALLTPPSTKTLVTNESRISHGQEILDIPPKFAKRDVSLTFFIRASGYQEFTSRLESLIALLCSKTIALFETKFQPGVIYKLTYQSSSQLTQVRGELGKIVVKFVEPNPADRT